MITGIDHVQLAMPPGCEEEARGFYAGVLGLREVEKPASLRARGGCWFVGGEAHVHVGVQEAFHPGMKAHPAFLVKDYGVFVGRLREGGVDVREDNSLPSRRRCFVSDPFGNRIELMEDGCGFTQASCD